MALPSDTVMRPRSGSIGNRQSAVYHVDISKVDIPKSSRLSMQVPSWWMTEGRKSQVVLLDERRLDILVQPKLYAGELLDIVASHFNLKEKEYFGLTFIDDTGHHNWLQLDRRVLEHDFPKKSGTLVLYFTVRFFIESITYLRDKATVELFYLQAKQSIYRSLIECDSETAFELAAHVLQASNGDFIDESTAKAALKKLPVIPTSALQEHPSITFCEEQVINHYKKLGGQTRGAAIVNYLNIVESLPTYGIHYYEVKDKSGIPWWLGLSYKGVAQYDHNDKKTPRRVFAWKQLENLYFRDKKFSIEVHDPKRIVHTLSSFNLYEDAIQEPIEDFDELSDAISDPTTQVSVSRRTFGPGNVNVHAWFAATPQLTKCIWSMAVSQHQFYLDRKQSKSQLPAVRSMSEIAADLSQSTSSLPSSAASDSISRSNSAHSLSLSSSCNSKLELTAEQLEEAKAAQRDMYAALKARKEALEEVLRKKTEELKSLCIKEGELTGILPHETPLNPGEPVPQIRRRIGTAFTLSPKIIDRDKTNEEEDLLNKLELEFELQDKITKAAQKLAHDATVGKSVRKQRRQSYHKAHMKLKDLEKSLNEARVMAGRAMLKVQSSVEDLSEDSTGVIDSEPEFISPVNSPAVQRSSVHSQRDQYPQLDAGMGQQVPESPSMKRPETPSSQGSLPGSNTVSPTHQTQGVSRSSTPSPGLNRQQYTGGYTPNAVYFTRTQYRNQMYPTFSSRSQSTSSSQSEYDNLNLMALNRGMGGLIMNNDGMLHNVYNLSTTQTGRYDSTDELKTPVNPHYHEGIFSDPEDDRMHLPSKHGSLEGAYKRRSRDSMELTRYGSLERNLSGNVVLQELTPSRFGSKRDSASDYKDSQYQDINVMNRTSLGPSDLETHEEGIQMGDINRMYNNQMEGGDYRGNSYMEGSMQMGGNGEGHWYGGGDGQRVRQQAPPHTPRYEVPPPMFVEGGQRGYEHETIQNSDSPQQVMTVTKFQSYVEVSKPFEMADYYKYSERLRRQRSLDQQQGVIGGGQGSQGSPGQRMHGTSSGRQTPQSPYISRLGQGQGQGSPGSPYPGQQPQSRSRPNSPFSPGQNDYEGSTYPVQGRGTPPSPANYQAVRTRAPYTVQSNLVQNSSYQVHKSMAYQSPQPSPRQMAYQPPQPLTCEPVQDSGSSGNSTSHSYNQIERMMASGIDEQFCRIQPVTGCLSDLEAAGQTRRQRHLTGSMADMHDRSMGKDVSFNFDTGESLAEAFSEEMLAWYEDQGAQKSATLV